MEKLLDILIPVVIVLFIAGGKLFAMLRDKGVDFGSLLKGGGENEPDYPPRKAVTRQEYNQEDEWGTEVIVVPPPHPENKRASLTPEKVVEVVVPENVKYAAKKAVKPAPQTVKSAPPAEEDEHHPSRASRAEYYSDFIHAHGKSAILIQEILSKPKGLE